MTAKLARGGPNAFLFNVLKLFAGNIVGQVASILAYPVLTRLYGPADLGILAFIASATLIIAPGVSLRYEMALPMARSDAEASDIIAAAFVSLLGVTLVGSLILWFLPPAATAFFGPVARYRMFLPLCTLAVGGNTILVCEATRRAKFGDIAKVRVNQSFNGPIVQIGLGFLHLGPVGLLFGFFTGQAAGTFGLMRRLLWTWQTPIRRVTVRTIMAAAYTYRHFALFASWASMTNAGATTLMVMAFPLLYGPAVGGQLFLAQVVLVRPMSLFTIAVFQVYMIEAGRAAREDPARLRPLFLGIALRQLVITGLWVGTLVVLGHFLITLVFGDRWIASARYVEVLAIGFVPATVVNTVMFSLQALGKQKLSAALDVGRFTALLATIAITYSHGASPLEALLACSIVQALAQTVVFFVMYREVSRAGGADRSRPNFSDAAML